MRGYTRLERSIHDLLNIPPDGDGLAATHLGRAGRRPNLTCMQATVKHLLVADLCENIANPLSQHLVINLMLFSKIREDVSACVSFLGTQEIAQDREDRNRNEVPCFRNLHINEAFLQPIRVSAR